MKAKWLVVIIVVVSIILFLSCNDTFEVIVKNNTGIHYTIKSLSFDDLELQGNGEKVVNLDNVVLPFRINVINNDNETNVWYIFRDVDHWLSAKHTIRILVESDGIIIESSGSTRFEKE